MSDNNIFKYIKNINKKSKEAFNVISRSSSKDRNLAILNTKQPHAVNSPSKDRLLFRIAIHDIMFEDLGIYKTLKLG